MTDPLSTEVLTRLSRILKSRKLVTYAQAARELELPSETWLRRRLTGVTRLTVDDVELLCGRLDIPITDVLPTGRPRKTAS